MSRLVVFGDSFADERPQEIAWPKLLSSKYGVPVKYYSLAATNLEYTSTKLFDYLENDYQETDIIVVILTSCHRAPIVHDDYYPAWSTLYKFIITDDKLLEKLNNPYLSEHIQEHESYYRTWLRFFNPKIHKSMCYFIARTVNSLPNKKLVLSAFEDSDPVNDTNRCECHPIGNLLTVSENEHVSRKSGEYFKGKLKSKTGKTGSWDARPNHLHDDNHYILTDYMYDCLEGNYSPLSSVKFKTDIFKDN
jgi:hypothetical protein